MEFRTNSSFDPSTGLNMSSPIVGGMGYNPMPNTFSYNGDGVGKYTNANTVPDPCQPPKQGLGYMNPPQPGGYVTSYNPYATMSGYGGYTQQQGGIIYDTNLPLSYQFYYQLGYTPTQDKYGNPYQYNGNNNYYANAWQLYNQRREEELNYQKHYEEQQEIWKHLTVLVRKNMGFDDGEEVYKKNIEAQQQFYAKQYEVANMDREYQSLCYISQFPTSADPNYINPQRQAYIEKWNSTYDKRQNLIPEGTTLYQFFNEGIATNMWMEMLTDEAIERAKDMTGLYNQQYFRDQLHKSNPNYDPLTGTAGGKLTINNINRGLNIDDMEITLPPHIANDEYAKKREKFMNTILSNTNYNISDLSTKNYMNQGIPKT